MNLADIVYGPWAITDEARATILEVHRRHSAGEPIDLKAIEAQFGRPLQNTRSETYDLIDGIATIPLLGVLGKRMNLLTAISGGTSTEIFRDQLAQAKAAPDVRGAIVYIDSPGGVVDGTQLTARAIADFATVKPIVAVAGGQIASAAYWAGSAAMRIFLEDETTIAGSIGVKGQHVDRSQADAKEGIVRTELIAGRYKGVGSDTRPLSDEDREILEARLNEIYTAFVDDVARHLGRSSAELLATIAEGRVFVGRGAVDAGLAHEIATLEQVRQRMAAGEFNSRTPGKPASQGAKSTMDYATLKAQHPDLLASIEKDAHAKGLAEGEAAGKIAGATAELERVKAVQAQSLPGHEKLIAELAFDGKTTGEQAAVRVLAAEREKGGKRLADLKSDADDAGKAKHTAAPDAKSTGGGDDDASLPVEERAKKAWAADPKLRAEFGSEDTYLAFVKAEASGQAKIFGAKSK